MKKHEDIPEENEFSEERQPVLLPELRVEKPALPSKHTVLLVVMVLSVISLTLIWCAIFFSADRRSDTVTVTLPPDESEEWLGAFLDSQVLESCLDSTVMLRQGRYGGERSWSGVIVSEDGWIATATAAVEELGPGLVYVTDSDGREYEVDRMVRRDRVTLMKVSANGLTAADLSKRTMHSGEILTAVVLGDEIFSVQLSNAESVRVGAQCSFECLGAPLFRADGELMGMICREGEGVTSEELETLLSKIK